MKLSIKIISLLLLVAVSLPSYAGAKKRKADKETVAWRYELECAGNGVQGTYLVKVWSYSKKAVVAAEQGKKNAVHGIIFKGYSGDQGCISQRPLVATPNAEDIHKDFFTTFFNDGGDYLKYVTLSSQPQEIMKVGREYKVGIIVQVQKDKLRRHLEEAGIIKSLNSGF